MSDHSTSHTKEDLKKIDQEIEEDIKHLKRSSNFLALLGLLVILILIALFGLRFMQKLGKGSDPEGAPKFIDVGIVVSDSAVVYAQPKTTSNTLGHLERDKAAFIMENNIDNWYKIQAPIIVNGENTGRALSGWMQRNDLQSKTEIRALQKQLSERVENTIDILDVKWTIDEVGNYTISGKVGNLTTVPLKNIKVLITFYDKQNRVVDTRTTFVATDNLMRKNKPVPFVFIGKNERDFNFVNCRVDYRIEEE